MTILFVSRIHYFSNPFNFCHRFLKYHLLLQEILKRTPDDHPDYVNLKLATEQMVKAGASVNEKKREQEECEKKERQDELGKKI